MSRTWWMVVWIVLFAAGMFVVFNSVRWGSAAANAYLQAQGGSMDGAQFMIVFQEYIGVYRWIGAILSILGGMGLIKTIQPG